VLKLIFALLVVANAALFAYGEGYLGQFSGNEHEPARLQKQLNVDKLQLVSASQAHRAAGPGPARRACRHGLPGSRQFRAGRGAQV
jgi:hypothetical protein